MSFANNELAETLKSLLTSPLNMREILSRLKVRSEDRSKMRRMVRALAESGVILKIKGNRYGLPEKMNLVTGVVQGHPDGYGFIIPDDPSQADVYIGVRNFDEAMHGDRVVCRIENTRMDGRREGRVIRVLERAHETISGVFDSTRGGGYVIPFDRRIVQDVFVPPGLTMYAHSGQAVIAEITDYPSKTRQPFGKIVKVLGEMGDPAVETMVVVSKFKLRSEFPHAAVHDAREQKAPTAADIAKRLDLRDRPIVTIDGETAKDFDDAVEVERLEGGKWRLGVHIADVSNYVREGSALDKEAYKRGTSVYFPGSVIPMLPFELSNDLCSLNPKVDRLTLSCIMTFDRNGDLIDYDIRESVIRSVERMTYTAVAAILEKRDRQMMERYAGLVESFRKMEELAKLLREKRQRNGALDFDLPEPEIILDVTGRPESIIVAERNVAHRIIEEFMLEANRVVAGHLIKKEYPAIFRVHDEPDPLKMEGFREFIVAFGFRFKPGDKIGSHKMQEILAAVDGKPEEKLVTHVMLRSMKQARYSVDNIGHFGLAFDYYTHFTSPIRRYPDLVVHRLLKDLLRKKRRDEQMAGILPAIAEHTSKAERNADEAERDIIKLRQTQYMADRVGEEFDGIISGVTAFGFFVELIEPPVEGLVRVASMHDDYYKYDERNHALIGERTKKRFRLGDKARIRIANVSTELRRIDLDLVTTEPGKSGGGVGAARNTRTERRKKKSPERSASLKRKKK